jgi:serine/threonine-protein kinase
MDAPDGWQQDAPPPSSTIPALEATPIDPLLGKSLGGSYMVLRRMGQGGAGAVYEAIGPNANRYAVRVVDPELGGADPVSSRRFLREARALLSIESPHVVDLVEADFDEALEQPFIVMELLHGFDLEFLVAKHGALDPAQVVPLVVQACRGLAAAHELGLAHRNIKPSNLLR